MTGYGSYYFACDQHKVYTGQFYCGDLYGNGVLQTKDFIYRGMFKNGEFEGFGRYEDLKTQLIYEGNFYDGLRDGFGKEYTSNNSLKSFEYEGHWSKGKKNGKGMQKIRKS